MSEGDHRGLPSPWITFIVSVDGPVRVSGTVDDGDRFDPAAATSYDVIVAGLHPVAARVEQPAEQCGVQLALHPLAAPALLGCRAGELLGPGDHGHEVLGRAATELHDRVGSRTDADGRLDVVEEWLRSRADDARRTLRAARAGPGLAGGPGRRGQVPGRGPRARRTAEPASAADVDGRRDRPVAEAAAAASSASTA